MAESGGLFEAAREYLLAAMAFLAKECPPGPPRVWLEMRRWRREGSGFYQRDVEQPYWVMNIHRHLTQIHLLGEFSAYAAALRLDAEIAPQIGALVGTPLSMIILSLDQVADRLIWRVTERLGGFAFDDAIFLDEYNRFRSELRQAQFDMLILAPLLGLVVETPPIVLAPGLEVDRLTDGEIERCLGAGFFPSPPVVHGYAHIDELYGVRIRHPLPKAHRLWSDPFRLTKGPRRTDGGDANH